ncbi:MAG: exosortase/archaeosortase family protein [Planctomycetota bacterium]
MAGAFLLLALGLAAWFNRRPLLDILTIGLHDKEQSHILLVPLVAAWLFWLRRSRLRYVRVRPSFIGPACVIVGTVMSWWGFNTRTDIAWHAGAGLTVLGALFTFTGLEPVKQFIPVFVVLVLVLPIPGVIRQAVAIPLQTLATLVAQAMLGLFGMPAARFGNVLVINGEQIAVSEATFGLGLVFAYALVVYALAFSVPLMLSRLLLPLALGAATTRFTGKLCCDVRWATLRSTFPECSECGASLYVRVGSRNLKFEPWCALRIAAISAAALAVAYPLNPVIFFLSFRTFSQVWTYGLALAIALPAVWVYVLNLQRLVHKRKIVPVWAQSHRGRTICPVCKYDLRGSLACGCPECGWRRQPKP